MSRIEGYVHFSQQILDLISDNSHASNQAICNNIWNIDISKMKNSAGDTLLHYAARYGNVEMLEYFIKCGFDVNAQNILGKTALMEAATSCSSKSLITRCSSTLQITQILLEANANIYSKDIHGKTVFHVVLGNVRHTDTSLQQFLVNIIKRESDGDDEIIAKKLVAYRCPLWRAALLVNAKIIEHMIVIGSFIDQRDPECGNTALHIAVKNMDLQIVKVLIKQGVDANAQNKKGETALMCALIDFDVSWDETVSSKLFKYLIEEGNTNIRIANINRFTALQLVLGSVNYTNPSVEKIFLEALQNESKNDSFHIARKLIELDCPIWKAVLLSDTTVVELILRSNSNMNNAALHRAVSMMNLQMIKLLIKHGADVDLEDNRGLLPIAYYGYYRSHEVQQPKIIHTLLARSILLQDLRKNNRIVQLRRAFEVGNREVIHRLTRHCKDIFYIKDAEGQTPLHYTVTNYHADITEELRGLKIDVNVRDNVGSTPLLIAAGCPHSHINTFRYLLTNGADVNARNYYMDRPLFAMCRNSSRRDFMELFELLVDYKLDINSIAYEWISALSVIKAYLPLTFAMPILAHLAIMERREISFPKIIQSQIDACENWKEYFNSCRRELVKLEDLEKEQRELTFYVFLVIPVEEIVKMCRYVKDSLSQLEQLQDECSFEHRYYSALIKMRISQVIEKIQ